MTDQETNMKKSNAIYSNCIILIIFALLKIVADFGVIYQIGYDVLFSLYFVDSLNIIYVCLMILSFTTVWDIPFMTVLLAGACKKSKDVLVLSFNYSLISLMITVTCTGIILYMVPMNQLNFSFYGKHLTKAENWLIHISIISAYTFIHIMMMMLMKSEITTTSSKDNQKYQRLV